MGNEIKKKKAINHGGHLHMRVGDCKAVWVAHCNNIGIDLSKWVRDTLNKEIRLHKRRVKVKQSRLRCSLPE